MGFNFDEHELDACVDYFGAPPCWRCDPTRKKPDAEFRFKVTEVNREAIEILFGKRTPAV